MSIFTRLVGKLWNLSISICKAVKGFVWKIGSIFFDPAHPLLPLQNPAASTSTITEPLLIHTPPLISSPTSFDGDRHSVCEDRVAVLDMVHYLKKEEEKKKEEEEKEKKKEEKEKERKEAEEKRRKKKKEKEEEETKKEKEKERKGAEEKRRRKKKEKEEEEAKEKKRQKEEEEEEKMKEKEKEEKRRRRRKKKEKEEEEAKEKKRQKEEEEKMKEKEKEEKRRRRRKKEEERQKEEEEKMKEKEKEEEKKKKEKRVIVVCEERWIKHYSSRHRILLVGEGNFSFSTCLAKAFRYAPNIIATSLDSEAFLKEHYEKALSNIEELRCRGGKVLHGIDATTMANHHLLRKLKFDRIVFNFPYAGLQTIKNLPRQTQLEHHRRLVSQFVENARELVSEKGEIHITHKTNGFHADWSVESIASGRGLRLIEAVDFELHGYPGYDTKCGFGGNNYFYCYPSQTYKFGLPSQS